jgi:molybdenum cofactor synthesis domain-containing protein
MKKVVPVRDAVGMVLCHDITRVVPGEFKGRAFKRGHVVEPEDISTLLDLGKENLYVLSVNVGTLHEDEAAKRIAAAVAGPGLGLSEPTEGRVDMGAKCNGLLKIDVPALHRVNEIQDVVLSTLHTNQQVIPGRVVAATRIIPLTIEEDRIEQVESICRESGPVVQVKPFKSLNVGIVTTGSEVFHGRIKDGFGPVLRAKFAELGCTVMSQVFVSDNAPMTVQAIHDFLENGAQIIAVTGGMSVDPDDQTPTAIRAAGADVVAYGSATFPGAMFMLAHIGDVPILGLPACVMYHRASIFDLVVPRILAGESVTRSDIVAMAHGGLCALCPECRYPICGFGKGS